MKAFQINDCDVYAGATLEEAIQAAIRDTGNTRDEVFEEGFGQEVAGEVRVGFEDEPGLPRSTNSSGRCTHPAWFAARNGNPP